LSKIYTVYREIVGRFLVISALMLLFVALLKVVSAAGSSKILFVFDPILQQKNRVVYLETALLEAVLASYLIFGRNSTRKLIALAWLATNFLLYHAGLRWMGVSELCACLGRPAEWWPWLSKHQLLVIWSLLFFFLVGSYGMLIIGAYTKRVNKAI